MSLSERAIQIAVEAHTGQVDKVNAPHVLHPLRMMCRMLTDEERIVAVLHDVVEDTRWTFDDLKREGFPHHLLAALDCVTKREGESYGDFLARSASNPLARRVKIADLEDNMDVRRLEDITPRDAARLEKYRAAWARLIGVAEEADGRTVHPGR